VAPSEHRGRPGLELRTALRGSSSLARFEGSLRRVTHEELLARITIDPAVCHGKPCIRGHRIWVGLVLGMLEGGMREEEILVEYPGLEPADIRACLAYASELTRVRFVDLPQAS
jgi:uncharacterized protein (DUF433 family)